MSFLGQCILSLFNPEKFFSCRETVESSTSTRTVTVGHFHVMFGALLCMSQRPGHKGNWNGSIWRVLKCGDEENGEDKMVRESN